MKRMKLRSLRTLETKDSVAKRGLLAGACGLAFALLPAMLAFETEDSLSAATQNFQSAVEHSSLINYELAALSLTELGFATSALASAAALRQQRRQRLESASQQEYFNFLLTDPDIKSIAAEINQEFTLLEVRNPED